MSTHCHRCIIHPQHNKVGVCGLCVRERLVALVDEYSSSSVEVEVKRACSSPASGTASDGAYHSFSSSAREHHFQLSPPRAPPAGSEQPIHLPPPATTSLLQKLKLKAFISIPPSPEHAYAFAKNATGFHSPSPTVFHQKNKLSLPFKSRKSSVSELSEGFYMHSKVTLEAGDDQISAPSTMRKPSLMSLFHQSEVAPDITNHTALVEGSENGIHAPSEERRRRIEQFSAAMRSPGFALPSTKAATRSDHRQTDAAEYLPDHGALAPVRGSTEHGSNSSSSSWIASLFQRKKRRASSKSKSKAAVSEATLVNEVLVEASARNSVDYARVSVDTGGMTPSLKQMIRSRVEAEAATNIPMNEVGAKTRYTQCWPPVDSEHFNAKVEPFTGSTDKMGINDKHYMVDHKAHVSEQARHFPRSRSWGRAWSRTHSSQFFTASPQHQLLGSSKQHLNKNNNVKLSSAHQHQHHYLTSTPKHPTMDAAAPKDSRVASGFYFGPFRRSKRQGGVPLQS